ncbi:hypothetical protein K3740_02745 [Ruegeria conchae]|uniref:hypothetical protein n=1 Tax=Ruegeria conchae TaxID=981384 RepID=UPI0021A45D28|nr:hypothetical protein [Ruegeria conchae]UWR03640.1 hypothetical protein K3740_02745 [Ruegeria conchae]
MKEFNNWLSKYSKVIMPIPNRGAIYAGLGKTNLMKMKKGLQAQPETIPMWKIIEKVEKDAREYTGYVTIDTINDVLKRIKSPIPKLVEATGANAGHPKKYSDMLSCVNALASDDWELLPKVNRRKVWNMVSAKYAENLSGDVQIWEGVSKRLRLLEKYKVMLQDELKKVHKNPKVSPKTRKAVEGLIKKYEKHYGELGAEAKSKDSNLKRSLKAALRK